MYAFAPYFRLKFGDNTIATFINCLISHVIMYSLGILWLGTIIGFEKAFYSGFVVFIPSGIAKIMILAGTLGYLRKS